MHCIAMKSWQLLFQKQCEATLFMKQKRMGGFTSVPEHIWMELSLGRSVCILTTWSIDNLYELKINELWFRYCLLSIYDHWSFLLSSSQTITQNATYLQNHNHFIIFFYCHHHQHCNHHAVIQTVIIELLK